MPHPHLDFGPSVRKAMQEGRPLVALESTIISHGMPYPKNVEMAREVERIIRAGGAEPATIAILNGRMKVGLSDEELEYLAQAKDVIKASRRDLPVLIAQKKNGATTVASTMIIAHLAGIPVFVTGGIGGVHRGAEDSMDISADLEELAETPVAVVCAGAKSILDIGLTLEYLETKGVPVLGYKTDELPAFYTRSSGFKVDYRMDTPQAIAEVLKVKWHLNLRGGAVIANPIPEAHAMPVEQMNQVIADALAEADRLGIKGKDTTPFLLAKVKEMTEGKSLAANIELVYNNAALGAKLAVALAGIL